MDPLTFLFKVATYTAGSRLREIQHNKEQAAAERLALREQARQEQVAAQEKARESRDPVYRAAKDAERAEAAAQRVQEAKRREAEGIAWAQERQLRAVQRVMFWLSFVSGLFMLGASAWLALPWLAFGGIWLYLCFVPKRFP